MVDLGNRCHQCSGSELTFDSRSADLICVTCGEIVTARMMDEGAEWTIYQDDENKTSAIRAEIFKKSVFEYETSMVGGPESTRTSLEQVQTKMVSHLKLRVFGAIDLVYSIGDTLKISPLIQRHAGEVFATSIQKEIYRSQDSLPLAAASLYVACRLHRFPRLLHELADATSVPLKILSKCQRDIVEDLQIQLPRMVPGSILPRLAAAFHLSPRLLESCRQTCAAIDSSQLLDTYSPQLVVAASLMLTLTHPSSSSSAIDAKAVAKSTYSSLTSVTRVFNIVRPHATRLLEHSRFIKDSQSNEEVDGTTQQSSRYSVEKDDVIPPPRTRSTSSVSENSMRLRVKSAAVNDGLGASSSSNLKRSRREM